MTPAGGRTARSARPLRFSFMRDRFSFTRIVRLVTRATRWHHGGSRQVWLIVLALVIAVCAEAVAVPARRSGLVCVAIGLLAIGFDVTRRQQQRRERAALAARLATLPGDDIPADVMELIAADKKIQAIKRYRQLTGAGLREAKAVIDGIVREG
jgi:ribosomal protein L7/L12